MTSSHTTAEPWWVARERTAKADRLARTLAARGATAADVVRYTDAELREVEAAAQVRRGSAATWRLTTDMLAGSTRRDAACPGCVIGDPDGDVGPPRPYDHPGACTRR